MSLRCIKQVSSRPMTYIICVILYVSHLITFLGTFPIDTTKTRLQIQGQTIDARHTQLKYRGMLHAATRIFSEEGVRALYSG